MWPRIAFDLTYVEWFQWPPIGTWKISELSNIMIEKLQEFTANEILENHLKAFNCARKGLVLCEVNEEVRGALRRQLRATKHVKLHGGSILMQIY